MKTINVKRSFVSIIFVMVMILTNTFAVLANSANTEELSDEQIISEINAYMSEQGHIFDLENLVKKYQIPLSNGDTATLTHEIRRVPGQATPYDIYTAKLGAWDFISTYSVGGRGSITVTTRVNVTYVPDMSTSNQDMVKFTASNGKVSAIPFQTSTISGSSANTKTISTNYWYQTTGFVGFSNSGVNVNPVLFMNLLKNLFFSALTLGFH